MSTKRYRMYQSDVEIAWLFRRHLSEMTWNLPH